MATWKPKASPTPANQEAEVKQSQVKIKEEAEEIQLVVESEDEQGKDLIQLCTNGAKYMFVQRFQFDGKEYVPKVYYREGSTYKETKTTQKGKFLSWQEVEEIGEMQKIQKGMDKWYKNREEFEDEKQLALKGPEEFQKSKRLQTLKGLLNEKKYLKDKIKVMQLEEELKDPDASSSASSSRLGGKSWKPILDCSSPV